MDAEAAWYALQRALQIRPTSTAHVVAVRNDDAQLASVSSMTGTRWDFMGTAMYMYKQANQFQNMLQLALATDPPVHNKRDEKVGVAFSHELRVATVPPMQSIPSSGGFLENEIEMLPEMQVLADQGKDTRRAAYMEMQCTFSYIG